ncbi:MAG: asparagine synthetase B [Candidatus Korobacteraceae bacterium]
MSRIVALFHRDGRPANLETLAKLVAPMRHVATDGPRFWTGGSAGLVYQCLQSAVKGLDELQPAVHGGNLAICFDGRLDNREELIALLASDLGSHAAELPDSSLVLACYRRFGENFAGRLIGDFALAIYDGSKKHLLFARDLAGARALYFWVSPKIVIAASEIKGILEHPDVNRQPNDLVLADLLIGGDPHELRLTCFKNVIRVQPGYTVLITPGEVREFRHWSFDPMRQIRLGSVQEYAEALRALFEQAVRRRLRASGPVAVMVSGGLDSSAILCQATKLWQSGAAVAEARGLSQVFPDGSDADEKDYLTDIEAMYGIGIHRLPSPPFRYVDEQKWLWRTEFPRMYLQGDLEAFAAARDLGCTTILHGDYGDQIMASTARLQDLLRTFRWLQFRREYRIFARSMREGANLRCFGTFFRSLIPNAMVRLMRALLRCSGRLDGPGWYSKHLRKLAYERRIAQRPTADRFPSKHIEKLHEYFTWTYVLNLFEDYNKLAASCGLEKAYPFMDRDIVEFVMAIPSEVVNLKGLYKGLFREAMRGILPEPIRLRFSKADLTAVNSGAAAAGFPRFREYFEGQTLSAVQFGYVNPARFADAFEEHRSQLNDQLIFPAWEMNSVVALELWLRTFFGSSPRIHC